MKLILKQGAMAVCNSESSRRDLVTLFPRYEDRTRVIHCVVSDDYFEESPIEPGRLWDIVSHYINPKATLVSGPGVDPQKMDLSKIRYILMVSTLEPRKNHARVLAAWNELRAAGHMDLKLLLVGSLGWEYLPILESLRPFQARGEAFVISGVPSSDLRRLYRNAEFVVCPSIAEGFDLSGVEAMLSGGVVAASDIPVHREIYGEACVLFNPYSTPSTADAMESLLGVGSAERRSELRGAGAQIGRRYLRSAIGQKWEELFDEIGARRAGLAPVN